MKISGILRDASISNAGSWTQLPADFMIDENGIIVDLFSQSFNWVALIHLIRESNAVPILGFGPHVDLSLREKALAAGCDAVVGRGAIASQLPHLVEKHKRLPDP